MTTDNRQRMIVDYPRSGTCWIVRAFQLVGIPRRQCIRNTHDDIQTEEYKSDKTEILSRCRVAFLMRDPRDIVVSYWHLATYRFPVKHWTIQNWSLFEYTKIRGFPLLLKLFNDWAKHDIHRFSYEDMLTDLTGVIEKLMDYFEIKPVRSVFNLNDRATMHDVGRMRLPNADIEQFGKMPPDDELEPNHRHCRRGEAGVWREYYTDDQIEWINEEMKKLSPIYPYSGVSHAAEA